MVNFTKFILFIFLSSISAWSFAKLSGSLEEDSINERLAPMGKVKLDNASNTKDTVSKNPLGGPKKIYKKYCAACHDAGYLGSPKLGDNASWGARAAQGLEELILSAINGINAMPAKGNCNKCTEEDIRDTVKYMLETLK